jgi:hypothetical protein
MLPQERLESLQRKHEDLSFLIEREEVSPSANSIYLRKLKQQKLMVKDILAGVHEELMSEIQNRKKA